MRYLRLILQEILSEEALAMQYTDGAQLELLVGPYGEGEEMNVSSKVMTGTFKVMTGTFTAQDVTTAIAAYWPAVASSDQSLTHIMIDLHRGSLEGTVMERIEVPYRNQPMLDDIWYMHPVLQPYRFPFKMVEIEILEE